MREIGHFVGGKIVNGTSGRFGEVFNPNTGEVAAKVALASKTEAENAIANAEAAFPGWAATNPQRRARVMFKFLELIQSEYDDLARLLSSEHGKTFADSKGDIQRGLEVVEFACGIPHLMKGEFTEGAGPGIDLFSMRQPLGVVAGITPFNFPAMIPLWKCAPAIACGNTFILKPSERDPSVPLRIAELFLKAGLPEGVLKQEIARFLPLAVFTAEVDRHVRDLRQSQRLPGVDVIRLPGDRRAECRAERLRDGVPLAKALIAQLDKMAAELKVKPLQER